MAITKQALYLLAVAALDGASKYHETQKKPKDKKINLPKEEKRA